MTARRQTPARRRLRHFVSALAAVLANAPIPAEAGDADEKPVHLSGEVTVDLAGVAAGGTGDRQVRALTNVSLFADADLGRLVGWHGAKAHVQVLDNRGARPNDAAGTLQGTDNIEVPNAGLRLFEAWVEQDLPQGASVLVGLYDLNSEFYADDAAGLLIAPPFGIGSELAATGPNGPSIFPSSTLAIRLNVPVGGDKGYVRAAVVNARASTIGDSGGVDFSFRDGILAIGEVGVTGERVRASIGGWRYSKMQPDLFETDEAGEPLRRGSEGAYAVVEGDLLPKGAPRQITAFLRAGLSDRHITPYTGGFQTGLLMTPALAGRKDSQLSIGLNHAWTSPDFHTATEMAGDLPAGGESTVELTYADKLAPWLSLQPDVQWIRHPGGNATASDAVVGTVRVTLGF